MDKREQILEATANLIAEAGLQSSPVSLVAKHACCGAGTIYRYFETKEELIEAVYLRQMEVFTKACFEGGSGEGSIREQLNHLWKNLFSYLSNNPKDAALIEQLGVAPEIRNELKLEAKATLTNRIHAIFEQGKASGEIKNLPNEILGLYAYGGISTLLRMKSTFEVAQTITEEMVLSLCWDAIANHE